LISDQVHHKPLSKKIFFIYPDQFCTLHTGLFNLAKRMGVRTPKTFLVLKTRKASYSWPSAKEDDGRTNLAGQIQ
jgi:hypothetical protein